MQIVFEKVREMHRKYDKAYISIACIESIKAKGLISIDQRINNHCIIICGHKIIPSSEGNLEVLEPFLAYELPLGDDKDEYPVLFVARNTYLPVYCEDALLNLDSFGRLIELKEKISANSTKVITVSLLKDILSDLCHHTNVSTDLWTKFSNDLTTYIQKLIEKNSSLSYLPVSERKLLRKHSVMDSSFAWRFYFKYFQEQWNEQVNDYTIPDTKKAVTYKAWEGCFFDRSNPLLKEYLGTSKRFIFNETSRESLYKRWKEEIERA